MTWYEEDTLFEVVVNDETQYSLWPMEDTPPAGWHRAGKQGTKADCLAWIEAHWTDMRPRSLREGMAENGA